MSDYQKFFEIWFYLSCGVIGFLFGLLLWVLTN